MSQGPLFISNSLGPSSLWFISATKKVFPHESKIVAEVPDLMLENPHKKSILLPTLSKGPDSPSDGTGLGHMPTLVG